MIDEDTIDKIGTKFRTLEPHLDERTRRLVAAAEAEALGHGGIIAVARATGVARQSIIDGIKELREEPLKQDGAGGRIRKEGSGRKKTVDTDPTLLSDLERLVDPVTRGDPESPLRWTLKSTRQLAKELAEWGHRASHSMVADLLHGLGYSLQGNVKTLEGGGHPDRNAQFEHINQMVEAQMAENNPVISVDTKKKELVGDFKNGGREWRPKGEPEKIRVHDFIDPELGRANPYGVYDLAKNEAWVSVGIDHDTATFAVETIRRWWYSMGIKAYPDAITEGGKVAARGADKFEREAGKGVGGAGVTCYHWSAPFGGLPFLRLPGLGERLFAFDTITIASVYAIVNRYAMLLTIYFLLHRMWL